MLEVSLSLSPVVFHYTSGTNLLNILNTNRFELTASEGVASEDLVAGPHYYLSTTRHRQGSFHQRANSGYVLITLDGVLLGQRYKGRAVDYWGQEYYNTPTAHAERNESEDRIISKTKPFIPNAIKFMKQVDIFYDWPDDYDTQLFRNAITRLKRAGIPVYVYDDKKAFLNGDKRKALDLDMFKNQFSVRRPKMYPRTETIKPWLELWQKPANHRAKLSKEAMHILHDIGTNLHYASGHARQLDSDITGARKLRRTDGRNRNDVDKLVGILRKAKITTKEFIEKLMTKWA